MKTRSFVQLFSSLLPPPTAPASRFIHRCTLRAWRGWGRGCREGGSLHFVPQAPSWPHSGPHPGLAYGRCSINSCRMNESRYVAKKQIFELTFLLDVLTSGLSSPQASVVTVVLTFASPSEKMKKNQCFIFIFLLIWILINVF